MAPQLSRRALRAAACLCLIAPAFVACSSPSVDAGLCVPAKLTSIETLQAGLTTDGTLRHARVHQRDDDTVFLSAELLPAGEDEDYDGDILTWYTADEDSGDFASVDDNARDDSMWPSAPFRVNEEGAMASRGCVLTLRGEPELACEDEYEELVGIC